MSPALLSSNTQADWPRIEAALDELLDLPVAQRPSALSRLTGGDDALLARVRTLLALATRDETWLDRPAARQPDDTTPIAPPSPLVPPLLPGQRVGAYQVMELIGQGGMGTVYRVARADGQFQHEAALKLVRRDAVDHGERERFLAERQILASLDHPGITRIYDGGLLDGRPYMVMELVDGLPITTWCRQRRVDLAGRLALFLAVCDAVAYAHRNLIVHRDLKPGNVLVTPQGQVKLLDFGIAKRIPGGGLDGVTDAETRISPLTPGYAAPEQLTGGMISTATDSYALGMLLYELLAGALPWTLDALPLARGLHMVLHEAPPPLHEFAARPDADPPVPPRALAGDIDAIMAKALRKEPAHRYVTVDALMQDLIRMRDGWPVSARTGSRLYVAGRFARRHRVAIGVAAAVALLVLGGFGGVSWQYLRAQREAARANTIKAFVLSLYGGRDAGFPTDQPRRAVSAEKLLDLGVDRIEREFAQDPDLEIELYGMTGSLYSALSDPDRAAAMTSKKVAVARKAYGDSHPMVIEAMLSESWDAIDGGDLDHAKEILARVDEILRRSGQDKTAFRALWWLNMAHTLSHDLRSDDLKIADADQAVALYARYAPDHRYYPSALMDAAVYRMDRSDYAGAAPLFDQALERLEKLPPAQRSDDTLLSILTTQGGAFERLGRLEDAQRNYLRASALALEVQGMGDPYWLCLFRLASILHREGRREEALAKFDALLKTLPTAPTPSHLPDRIRLIYADCLTAEGRAGDALPILEHYRTVFTQGGKAYGRELRRLNTALAAAYGQLGRIDDAKAAYAQTLKQQEGEPESTEQIDLLAAWGWFMLRQGDAAAAAGAFDHILNFPAGIRATSISPALAWAGKARLALAAGDSAVALAAVTAAFTTYDQVHALHDARVHTTLLLTRSAVWLAQGKKEDAARDAAAALADARRMDAPQSPVIGDAQAALDAARL